MRRFFVLNFAILIDNCAVVCCFVPTYAKLTEMQISGTRFATVQTVRKAESNA